MLVLAFVCSFDAIFALNYVSNYTQNPDLQIQLPEGLIQGRMKHTVGEGMPFRSYEGIPYAKPPVGELRFRPPEPASKWEGVLSADGDVPNCIQLLSSDEEEAEDCLYLNVYVPQVVKGAQKAVLVWIYGGGFLFGVANSTYYGPDYLLEDDVIVVHFNYRLNVFGFLSTEDMASPGNYGLKDQLLALQWVQRNIHLFGGDPHKVTIFGESAGGASVQYHLLSPRSRGLFHAAISESGSVLCPWALQTQPRKVAFMIGEATGFDGASSEELVEHLRGLSTRRLKRAATSAAIAHTLNIVKSLPFSPTLEPNHEDAFVSQKSWALLEEGRFNRVPYIVGFNSEEAGMARKALEVAEPLLYVVSSEVLIPPGVKNRSKEVGEKIDRFYFGEGKSRSRQCLDFINDSYFYRPISESARLYSLHAPVYMYKFSYAGYYLGKKAFSMREDSDNGVMHAEEVWYLFARDDLRRVNHTDRLIRKRMVRLWTNFAKFGNPTPVKDEVLQDILWPKYSEEDDYPYLDIDRELKVGVNFRGEMLEFWRSVFREHGQPPFDTY